MTRPGSKRPGGVRNWGNIGCTYIYEYLDLNGDSHGGYLKPLMVVVVVAKEERDTSEGKRDGERRDKIDVCCVMKLLCLPDYMRCKQQNH